MAQVAPFQVTFMHSEPSSYYETGDTGSETSVSATRGKLLHVLMRDEKEKRKKQARSNHRSRSMVKQTNKAKQHVQVRTYVYMHVSLILYFAHV